MRAAFVCLWLLAACSSAPPPELRGDAAAPDGAPARADATPDDAGANDAGIDDASGPLDAGDAGSALDGGADAGSFDAAPASWDAGPPPTRPLSPVPGELTIFQLDLPPGVTLRLGEAAVVVGPAGSIALIDVGNSNHDDEVRARVAELNQSLGRPGGQVEWIVLTHFHGDHIGAMADLFSGATPLTVTRGVVHRGFVDLGDGMNVNDYAELCDLLTGPLAARAMPLCASASTPPCVWSSGDDPAAAVHCDGLTRGDLEDPSDDALGMPAFFDLDGVRVSFSAANAWLHDGAQFRSMSFGRADGNEENGRSLVGQIEYGGFRYHFGGDLTGSGDPGEPDVESFWSDATGARIYGTLGADVVHAHHHARRTSSNANLIDLLAPADGLSRNVVAGINATYVGSPAREVVAAWTDQGRLGSGAFWVTQIAPGGADASTFPALISAQGEVIVQTFARGDGYWIQAAGPSLTARAFPSLR